VEVYLHAFLTLALDKMSGQLHAPTALPPGKEPRYPLDKMLEEGGHKRYGHDGKKNPATRIVGMEV